MDNKKFKKKNVFHILSERFEADVVEVYNFENSVEQYSSIGGTAKSSVLTQINNFKMKHFF